MAISCVALFMVVLDTTIVTLALPQMHDALDMSVSEQQWVVTGYLITLGGFLLLAARAGDLFGHKRVFLFGMVVFTAASLVGGLATSPTTLIVSRFVQGIGAAALTPTSLSLITTSHTDETQRQRALSLWSITIAFAGTAGVLLGGVLTSELNWRWVLFINIPPGVALFTAAVLCLLPARVGPKRVRLDLPGALSVTLGIGALSYGLSQASADGWGSSKVLIALGAAVVLIACFVAVQITSAQPLIPRTLFRLRTLALGNLVMFLLGVVLNASFFFISLYLQQAIGYGPLRAGMAMVPVTLIVIVGGFASRKLVLVLGPRNLIIIGGLVVAAGMAWLSGVPARPPVFLAHILGPTLIVGIGLGFLLLSITLTGTSDVGPEDAGAASGLLNTSRQVGGAIGLAVLTTIAATATTNAVDTSHPVEALVHGYRVAFLICAGVMIAAALIALALPNIKAPRPEAGEKVSEERSANTPS
ncbi:DHA2 family efflux MFS transporter permease subunit [Streptomyces paludis]|uniref:DHA2 family efflux MFS transporter permease subunit n=1 Tax=Streptomyces paludis TaxID=2282738 RepID=UPI0013B3E688|nr:DHA2 family efflux MFS transporter permease subunit [Streptomyces paludis]